MNKIKYIFAQLVMHGVKDRVLTHVKLRHQRVKCRLAIEKDVRDRCVASVNVYW